MNEQDIILHCLRITIKDIVAVLPAQLTNKENMLEYYNRIKDDDKNNHIIIAIQEAIRLTKEHLLK